jgi:hypothetical protein
LFLVQLQLPPSGRLRSFFRAFHYQSRRPKRRKLQRAKKRSQRDDEEEGKNVTKKLEKSVVSNESQFLFIIFVSCRSLSRSSFFFSPPTNFFVFARRSLKTDKPRGTTHTTSGPAASHGIERAEKKQEKKNNSQATSRAFRAARSLGSF